MCTVYAVHEIDGVFVLCICERALCCEDRWIVARVPASSQTSAPKMTSSNFGTKDAYLPHWQHQSAATRAKQNNANSLITETDQVTAT